MQTPVALLVIALSLRFCAGTADTPLHNAVSALETMRDENLKTAQEEDAEYKVFTEWCRKESKQLKFDIKDGKAELEDTTAKKLKAESDISTFSAKIDDAASSQGASEGELKAAKAVREKEHKTFVATEKELVDSISTLERAFNVIQRKNKGAALLETDINSSEIKQLITTIGAVVKAASLSVHDKKTLMSLTQNSEDDADTFELSGPATDSVLDMIEDLKQKAETQLRQLRKDETNMRYNFESVQVSLKDEIKLAASDLSEAKDSNSQAASAKAAAEGDMAGTGEGLAKDEASLKALEDSCVSKAAEYDTALENRKQEASALGQALKAIKDSSFLQLEGQTATSFLQLKSSPGFEVVNVLRDFAQRKHNAALSQLAARVSTVMTKASSGHEANPFQKVSDMITGMVAKLEKEGAAEATAKATCEKQKKEADAKMDDLKFKISKRDALMDKGKAKVSGLNEEAATLQRELSEMTTAQAEADEMRRVAKKTFVQLESDLTRGVAGVRAALKVLRAQYGQSPAGAMSGILSMLELVEEDTGKSLRNAKAEESAAVADYKKYSEDTKFAKLTKEKAQGYKEKESRAWAKTLLEYSSDLDALSTELEAVKDEYCQYEFQKVETYADKLARRTTELEGLKEAMAALEGQAASLLQRPTRHHSSLRGDAKQDR